MMQSFTIADWITITAFLLNLGAIAKGYAHFEHRFTKLETQMDMLLRRLQNNEGN